MRDKEEIFENELKILNNHYDKFHFGNCKLFISSFEDKETKDLINKEYTQIAQNNNHEVIFIANAVDLKELLVKPVLAQCYLELNEKFLKDKTFIVDIDNDETVEMVTELRNISHHFHKKTQATLHLFLKSEHIINYIAGSDLWEFRDKTFHYPAGDISKIKFKQMMESTLESKPSNVKKAKI